MVASGRGLLEMVQHPPLTIPHAHTHTRAHTCSPATSFRGKPSQMASFCCENYQLQLSFIFTSNAQFTISPVSLFLSPFLLQPSNSTRHHALPELLQQQPPRLCPVSLPPPSPSSIAQTEGVSRTEISPCYYQPASQGSHHFCGRTRVCQSH